MSQRFLVLALMLGGALTASGLTSAQADDVRYGYDPDGQLTRMVGPDGQTIYYRHDPAGNIVAVEVDASGEPPQPEPPQDDRIRCGQQREIVLAGEGLAGATIQPSSPELVVSELEYTETGLRFLARAECDSALEELYLSVVTPEGVAELPLTVEPRQPDIIIRPSPLPVAPDGGTRNFRLSLSHSDTRTHQLSIGVQDEEYAELASEGEVTLAPGDLGAAGTIVGASEGTTTLTAASAELGTVSVPVLVTDSAVGVNSIAGMPLGLEWPPTEDEAAEDEFTAYGVLGVTTGIGLLDVDPGVLRRGDADVPLRIHGVGLEDARALTLHPDEGVEIGNVEVVDGSRLSATATVAANAPVGLRRLEVAGPDGVYPAIEPGADRLTIAHEAPVIESIEPARVRIGSSGVAFTVRGRHLDDARSIDVHPSEGVTVGAPTVSDSGSTVTTAITVEPAVEPGARTVTVRTSGGESSAASPAANTLRLVDELGEPVEQLAAASLGIVREHQAPDDDLEHPEFRGQRIVGDTIQVLSGAYLESIEPQALVVGETQELTLHGRGLGDQHAIDLVPDDDLSFSSSPVFADDGAGATVHVDVLESAEPGLRRVVITDADGRRLPPVVQGADVVNVTPAGPTIKSVTPVHLPTGNVTALVIRGRALQDATTIDVTPGDGLTLESPEAQDEGTLLTARVAVAEGAEPGPRQVEVTTPAGIAGAEMTPANTIRITADPLHQTMAHNHALGVHLEPSSPARPPGPPEVDAEVALASMRLGVHVESEPVPTEQAGGALAPVTGVVIGAAALGMTPDGVLAGGEYTLRVQGVGLEAVQDLRIARDEYLEVGDIDFHAPDQELRIDLTVGPAARPGYRRLELFSSAGRIPFADNHAGVFYIGAGAPVIDSISPILAGRGDTEELVVRGEHLHGAELVTAEPSEGVILGPFLDVNEAGTELRTRIGVRADAALGARVIRVRVPGGESTAEESPANTFSVYESVPD